MEVDRAEGALRHKDIVGAVQLGKGGVRVNHFKTFSTSSDKEIRDAVVKEARKSKRSV